MYSRKSMIFCLVLTFSLLLGCREQDEEKDSSKDLGETSWVKTNGGKNRLKLSWQLKPDSDINKVIVSWNNKAESVELRVNQGADVDTMEVIIDNIEEGYKTFNFFTSDGINTPTFQTDVTGRVYGEIYKSQLPAGGIKNTIVNNGTALIDWELTNSEVVGVELQYTNIEDVLQEVFVPSNTETTLLQDFAPNNYFDYRTLYLPDQALDTMFTEFTSSRDLIRYRSPLTKQIVEEAGLVNIVLFDTLMTCDKVWNRLICNIKVKMEI